MVRLEWDRKKLAIGPLHRESTCIHKQRLTFVLGWLRPMVREVAGKGRPVHSSHIQGSLDLRKLQPVGFIKGGST